MILRDTLRAKLVARHNEEQRQLWSCSILTRMNQDLQQLRVRYEEARLQNQAVHDASYAFLVTRRARLEITHFKEADYQALLAEAIPLPGVRLKSAKSMRKAVRTQRKVDARNGISTTLFSILERTCRDRYYANETILHKIHMRRIPAPTRPIAGSRVYSLVTNISSWLRPYLYRAREEQQNLWNLDISNSQPLLLCALLRDKFGSELPPDAQRYVDLTCAGAFYQTIAQEMKVPCATDLQRKAFKQGFFAAVFFCRNEHTRNSAAGIYFREEFPTVAALIEEHKRERYQNLAIRMQAVEAHLMIDVVAAALQRKRIWCCTVHDSILCLAQHREVVKALTLAAFQKAYQLTPNVTGDELCTR